MILEGPRGWNLREGPQKGVINYSGSYEASQERKRELLAHGIWDTQLLNFAAGVKSIQVQDETPH